MAEKCTKSVMHVYSCCFAKLNQLLFVFLVDVTNFLAEPP